MEEAAAAAEMEEEMELIVERRAAPDGKGAFTPVSSKVHYSYSYDDDDDDNDDGDYFVQDTLPASVWVL